MTSLLTTIHPRNARPNACGKLDTPAISAAEALRADCARVDGAVPEIARLALVSESAVYKWLERDYSWPVASVEAVVRVTGGLHVIARLRRLGAPALRRSCSGPYEILQDLAASTERLARLTNQTARDLAPDDDTPGELDRDERRRVLAQLGHIRAALDAIATAIEEGI